ncbi:PREDICTED: GSK-3-binding protein FRAT2 [Dipodomys ordii]|uniref:GSK-3-binding protein FRAT2 n=1 Tax=Dipodomys ordii TaxID=10020 RepID=A0A1S3F911_DIPOR|nr:PREDICTED: GSK-3-binding protein FRAT2 [Dipodomys ordii]
MPCRREEVEEAGEEAEGEEEEEEDSFLLLEQSVTLGGSGEVDRLVVQIGWLRGAVASRRLHQRRWTQAGPRAGDDDPHRLLQQLVLSGNLIKEAVRRLQRAVAAVAATNPATAPESGSGCSGTDPVTLQTSGTWL